MSGRANEERKPLTTKKVRWIGLAMVFLIAPLCSLMIPYLGSFVILAGLYVVIRAKRIAAKYGTEETNSPAGRAPVRTVPPELPVAPKYSRRWWQWDSSVHESKGQPARMQRALTQSIVIREVSKKGIAKVQGTNGDVYKTSFLSCSCPDFAQRIRPCKHMYLLASRYAGFDPVSYIIRNHVKSHPLRGFMNLGMFKVTGKNFETGRMNTKTIYALDQAQAIQMAASEFGLVDPLSGEEVAYPEEASESKVEMAAEGIYIPAGANLYDCAAARLRYQDEDEVTITQEQWEYAAKCGIRLSALAGETGTKEIFREHHKRWKK